MTQGPPLAGPAPPPAPVGPLPVGPGGPLPPGPPQGPGPVPRLPPGMGPVPTSGAAGGIPGAGPGIPPGLAGLPGPGGPGAAHPAAKQAAAENVHEPGYDPSQLGPRPQPARPGSLEGVSDLLAEWLYLMPQAIAGSLMDDSGRPPFAARITGRERLTYYDHQFFLPDGSPNLAGRQREAQRLGEEQFQQTLARVALARGRGVPGTQTGPGHPAAADPAREHAPRTARRIIRGWGDWPDLPDLPVATLPDLPEQPLEGVTQALYG